MESTGNAAFDQREDQAISKAMLDRSKNDEGGGGTHDAHKMPSGGTSLHPLSRDRGALAAALCEASPIWAIFASTMLRTDSGSSR